MRVYTQGEKKVKKKTEKSQTELRENKQQSEEVIKEKT